MKIIGTVVMLAFAILFCNDPVQAATQDLQQIEVPVLFATTRNYDDSKKCFGPMRNYEHRDHGIRYGVVNVTIKTPHSLDQTSPGLECKPSSKKIPQHFPFQTISTETDFSNRMKELKSVKKFDEVCVFVHGYNNSFDGAAASAARLQVALNKPVILFTWPSKSRLSAYVQDECNAEWSVRPFQLVMGHIEEAVGPESMMTVTHSMGNRLINWYLQSRSDKNNGNPAHYKEVVLTSPDVDRATFKNYFYKISDNADQVRVYLSSKDVPLRLSKGVHGEDRAGHAVVDRELHWQVPSNLPRAQIVNFSSVDSGWLGHSIQYDIISAMHRTKLPGTGLKATPDKTYKGDYVVVERDN